MYNQTANVPSADKPSVFASGSETQAPPPGLPQPCNTTVPNPLFHWLSSICSRRCIREIFQIRKCSFPTALARHRRRGAVQRRHTAIWISRHRTLVKSEMSTRVDPTSPCLPIPEIKERACRTRELDPLPTTHRPLLTFPAAMDTRIRISSETSDKTPTRLDCLKTLRGAPARRLKTFHTAPARWQITSHEVIARRPTIFHVALARWPKTSLGERARPWLPRSLGITCSRLLCPTSAAPSTKLIDDLTKMNVKDGASISSTSQYETPSVAASLTTATNTTSSAGVGLATSATPRTSVNKTMTLSTTKSTTLASSYNSVVILCRHDSPVILTLVQYWLHLAHPSYWDYPYEFFFSQFAFFSGSKT